MNSNLDKIKVWARLLLAADRWRELLQFLERDVPALIAEWSSFSRSCPKPGVMQHGLAPCLRFPRLQSGDKTKANC